MNFSWFFNFHAGVPIELLSQETIMFELEEMMRDCHRDIEIAFCIDKPEPYYRDFEEKHNRRKKK